mmetsp:Transcript_9130/g.28301  ORF Transcript_9130/g.28301 Transcript_9130/m.28301 type:complete len:220 (+) Transcript_9130:214-873(+)
MRRRLLLRPGLQRQRPRGVHGLRQGGRGHGRARDVQQAQRGDAHPLGPGGPRVPRGGRQRRRLRRHDEPPFGRQLVLEPAEQRHDQRGGRPPRHGVASPRCVARGVAVLQGRRSHAVPARRRRGVRQRLGRRHRRERLRRRPAPVAGQRPLRHLAHDGLPGAAPVRGMRRHRRHRRPVRRGAEPRGVPLYRPDAARALVGDHRCRARCRAPRRRRDDGR